MDLKNECAATAEVLERVGFVNAARLYSEPCSNYIEDSEENRNNLKRIVEAAIRLLNELSTCNKAQRIICNCMIKVSDFLLKPFVSIVVKRYKKNAE